MNNYNAKKLDNLGKMAKFLETYNLQKLNQEDVGNCPDWFQGLYPH